MGPPISTGSAMPQRRRNDPRREHTEQSQRGSARDHTSTAPTPRRTLPRGAGEKAGLIEDVWLERAARERAPFVFDRAEFLQRPPFDHE